MTVNARTRSSRPRSPLAVAATALLILVIVVIQAPAAWAFPTGAYWYSTYGVTKVWKITKGAGVTVALLEAGVNASVGDLKGQILNGIDLAGNNPGVHTEKAVSKNFGHGTAMAALIAGTGKGGGLYGMAPAAKILPVDVSPTPGAAEPDLVATGIRKAVARGVQVINLSFAGTGGCTEPERSAVAYAFEHNVIVVAGAGDSPGSVLAPASCPGAIAIGGVDSAFKPWTRTPSGPEIDFVAPAFDLVNEQLDGTLSGPYPENAGTSQATAITSGIFALLRAHYPKANVERILQIATNNVHNGLGVGKQATRIDNTLGYGEILPYFALTKTTPTNAPNPVYDAIRKQLGPASSASSGSSASSSAPSGSGAQSSTSNQSASSSAPPNSSTSNSASSDSGDSSSVLRLIVEAVIVVVLIGLVIVFVSRRKRRSGPPPLGR